jgi:hypothetical protein
MLSMNPIKAQTIAAFVLSALVVCFSFFDALAQGKTMQYQQLPPEIRKHADDIHRACKEQDDQSQPHDLMQGITVLDLDGNGARDLLVDDESLCNSAIKGGNCSNRGCDLKIWKQTGQRSWQVIFDQHVSQKFISTNEKGRLNVMALSIYAGSDGNSQCKPEQGSKYCDALVRYKNGKVVYEILK